ncbi:hypothetical protein BBU72A_D0021 (plasmid) [Borreliella burgdorferi 72a]|nr:hypothetical protein BBU72A_D0021 [Borreliella burgdorferi 72a]
MLFTYIKSIVIYRPYFKNFFTLGTFNIFSYSSYIYIHAFLLKRH